MMSITSEHPDINRRVATLLSEEAELDFARFSVDDAWSVGSRLRQTAVDDGHAVTISIILGTQRVFHAATSGVAAVNDAWLERKLRVVEHYAASTLRVRYEFLERGEDFARDSLLDRRTHVAAGGAFPLRVQGTLVGGIGVSGLEMHKDHDLVVEALRAHAANT
ncbi:heme-degrading domain-containing protein [Microbacterium yannicii]|uniref:heme-degrading domain-containing protein n=1 Tax=Microbacterium yannicii TaxID=671622 RepID=UPI00030AA311|nr:heme-binding protein [Microbacterium yannicii]